MNNALNFVKILLNLTLISLLVVGGFTMNDLRITRQEFIGQGAIERYAESLGEEFLVKHSQCEEIQMEYKGTKMNFISTKCLNNDENE